MYSNKSPVLKYKRGIYSNSTGSLTFNADTIEAHSYRWWKFVAVIDGLVVFNNYRYSPSTSKHQYVIRCLLEELGIKIDLELPLSKGINSECLESLIETAEIELCDQFLYEQYKKQERYQRTKERAARLQAQKDAEFKTNMDSITMADVIAFRAAKGN